MNQQPSKLSLLAKKIGDLHQKKPVPNLLLVGDLMLDHYVIGNATRLSPEAPVPVVKVEREYSVPGGAANVALNLTALDAQVALSGVVGVDPAGETLTKMLHQNNIATHAILTDKQRITTLKTRILAHSHQITRIDKEDQQSIAGPLENELYQQLLPLLEQVDMVLLSDYNKGLLTTSLIQKIIQRCQQLQKKVLVDPAGLDYSKYQGAFIIKPNKKEIIQVLKIDQIASLEALQKASIPILQLTNAAYLVVTLAEKGMVLLDKERYMLFPVAATEVFDVTGAGDTVLAVLAYFIALGCSIEEACMLANYAAARVVQQAGNASASVATIIQAIHQHESNH